MRKGELLRLKRDDVNFGSVSLNRVIKGEVWEILPSWLLIEKTKNGKPTNDSDESASCGHLEEAV